MKTTAVAPSNIAFIKYWGKRDAALRLPTNASVSMNLSEAYTTTTVEFSTAFSEDTVTLEGQPFTGQEVARVSRFLDLFRSRAKMKTYAKVVTKNNFPKSSGIASSASGFAALTVAAAAALGLAVSEKELTILARLGSGSACRSIPDGFVLWEKGESSEASFAHSLYPSDYWDLRDIVVMVGVGEKHVSSTHGHEAAATSPLFEQRLQELPGRLEKVMEGLQQKNLALLGDAIEADAMSMHQVMQTQAPPLQYFTAETKQLMKAVVDWRNDGIPVYYTIDAGPNVHLICEGKNEVRVLEQVRAMNSSWNVLVNKPAPGAHILDDHLF